VNHRFSGNGVLAGLALLTLCVVDGCGGHSHGTVDSESGQGGQAEPGSSGGASSGGLSSGAANLGVGGSTPGDAGATNASAGGSSAGSAPTSEAGSAAVAAGAGGIPQDPPDGVWSPNLPIEGDSALVVLSSTLGRDRDGQIRWLFTFRNDAEWPLCGYVFDVSLYDSSGTRIAGTKVGSEEYLEGMPVFTGVMFGSIHEFYQGGVLFLDSCVAPGGRGAGWAELWTAQTFDLPEEQVSSLLDSAAKIQHDLKAPASDFDRNLKPAPDLPSLQQLELFDSPEGKVVRGVAISRAELLHWKAYTLLYDANGAIIDFVNATNNATIPTPTDSPVPFSSPPVLPESRRFEIFFESSSLKRN